MRKAVAVVTVLMQRSREVLLKEGMVDFDCYGIRAVRDFMV